MILVWLFSLTVLLVRTIKCEPPVNSYLPPTTGFGGRPSSQYGPPNQGRPSGSQNQPGGNYAQGNYPSNSLSSEYGVPGRDSSRFPSDGQRGRQGQVPDQQYGTPNQQGPRGGGSSSFSGRGSQQRPDNVYGAPSSQYQSGNFNDDRQQNRRGQQFGGSPSSSYGTPDFGNDLDNTNQNYRGSGVEGSNAPAKYEFNYEVDDAETGTKFGHSEQRDGDVVSGEYNVVLPDGRKQVVEYEADREGYKPQIRYEGNAGGSGAGFGRGGAPGGNQGYPQANADASAFAGSGGYPQQTGRGPADRYQQPNLGSGPSSGRYQDGQGYPGTGIGGASGYPSGPQGGSGRGPQGGSTYPGNQGNDGFPGGRPQAGRNSPQGGNEGYPSGGPNGPRGSGY